jgi:branched-chain amino acid transport system ATP-binding protein
VNLDIGKGEVIGLIGHNASGKSTLLKALFGVIPPWAGDILLAGQKINPSPMRMAGLGAAYVPQGNVVFPDLTVSENLQVRASLASRGWKSRAPIDEVLGLFPALGTRFRQKAGSLSGGEKQLLALASALVLRPKLLVLDEPCLGLAPGAVVDLFERLRQVNEGADVTLLIVEQRVRDLLRVAHRIYVLRAGEIAFNGSPEDLQNGDTLRQVFL